jgi:7-carboxy-7-deazaguanine synthase
LDKQGSHVLKVNEIFLSVQGETSRVGLPTVFIRLTGCPLRCGYCDTEYAFYDGVAMPLEAVMKEVKAYGIPYVTVTGGEPLAQKECLTLLATLCDAGYSVSLETSGALDIAPVDPRVCRIMDIKTPGSGEVDRNCWGNLHWLTAHDEVKFVLCDRHDYDWAKAALDEHKLASVCPVLFSPVHDQLSATVLAQWILEDRLPVRVQIQLHKYLWGEERGR